MQINLRNHFTIQCGDNISTINNTMLPHVGSFFTDGRDYTAYIAVGTGRHQNTQGIAGLAAPLKVYSAQTSAYNYNALNGALFIKKYAEIAAEDFNGQYISEVGFSPDASGAVLANYATLPQGSEVQKQPGKKLIITAIVYVNIHLNANALLTGGDNAIVKAALGQYNIAQGKVELALSDCISSTQNLTREAAKKLKTFPCTVQTNTGLTGLEITANLTGADGEELLLLMDDMPALRLSAKKCGAIYNYTQELQIEGDTARIDGEFAAVPQAVGESPPQFLEYKSKSSGVTENPLDMALTMGTKYYAGSGNYFAVHYGDLIKVYKAQDGTASWLPFEGMPAFSFYDVTDISIGADGDVHFYLAKSPYKVIYVDVGGRLKYVSGVFFWQGTTERIARRTDGGYIYRDIEIGKDIFVQLYKYQINGQSYSEQVVKTFPQGAAVYFDSIAGGEIVLLSDGTVQSGFYNLSQAVKKLIKNSAQVLICGDILLSKTHSGAWYSADIASGNMLQLSDVGIRSIYYHKDARRFAVRYSDNSIGGWYFDGFDINGHKVESIKLGGGNIEDVLVLGDGSYLINVRARHIKTVFLPMDKSTYLIKPNSGTPKNVQLSLSRYTFRQKTAFHCVLSV